MGMTIQSICQTPQTSLPWQLTTAGAAGQTHFQRVFAEQLAKGSLHISAHAQQRLAAREIDLTPDQMGRLEDATSQAASKGGRESLILLDNLAFVVSVPNRTVITAMERDQLKESVFTNIDSAVLDA